MGISSSEPKRFRRPNARFDDVNYTRLGRFGFFFERFH